MEEERCRVVKEQFETDYETYDQKVRDVLPDYEEMHERLIQVLDFPSETQLSLLDLGVGTGYCIQKVLEKCPSAKVTGVDLSPKMLAVAKNRLVEKSGNLTFIEADMIDFEPKQNYDAIVGVLSIHHLTSEQKQELYKKVFKHLNSNGIFAIGDLKVGDTEEQTREIEHDWAQYLVSKFGRLGADEWLKIYHEEDIPESVSEQIQWLRDTGFLAEVKWQKGNLAMIIGKKL